jgi:ribosome-associated protein
VFDENAILQELTFKAIRSSGSGGQHVNKVSSKVELLFNLKESRVLNDVQKERLLTKLKHRLTKDGILILQCGESRSQHKNKEIIMKRFIAILREALKVPKKRRPTKIPKSAIRRRLKSKRNQSDKKSRRKKPDFE